MGKKRDKANENIVILIDELVDTKIYFLGDNCPYADKDYKPCIKFESNCEYCKESWGYDKKSELLEKYFVK